MRHTPRVPTRKDNGTHVWHNLIRCENLILYRDLFEQRMNPKLTSISVKKNKSNQLKEIKYINLEYISIHNNLFIYLLK